MIRRGGVVVIAAFVVVFVVMVVLVVPVVGADRRVFRAVLGGGDTKVAVVFLFT